jgi:hypothetical protein
MYLIIELIEADARKPTSKTFPFGPPVISSVFFLIENHTAAK